MCSSKGNDPPEEMSGRTTSIVLRNQRKSGMYLTVLIRKNLDVRSQPSAEFAHLLNQYKEEKKKVVIYLFVPEFGFEVRFYFYPDSVQSLSGWSILKKRKLFMNFLENNILLKINI